MESLSEPSVATLTRRVVPAARSRTNTSTKPLASPATRSAASEPKATNRPSPEIAGDAHWKPSALCPPSDRSDTRSVDPDWASRTNVSQRPFVSPATRFDAFETNAVKRPSADVDGP